MLQNIIFKHKPKVVVEIGLAYGISSMFISDALIKVGGRKHIILDPYQDDSYWKNIGILNLNRSGLSALVDFQKDFSQIYLPSLHASSEKIDFAYIDSTKVFDLLLVDIFLF